MQKEGSLAQVIAVEMAKERQTFWREEDLTWWLEIGYEIKYVSKAWNFSNW